MTLVGPPPASGSGTPPATPTRTPTAAARRSVVPRGHHALPIGAVVVIAAGALAWSIADARAWAPRIWLAGLIIFGAPVVWRAVRDALRGRFATDLVAMLAIVVA